VSWFKASWPNEEREREREGAQGDKVIYNGFILVQFLSS